MPDGVLCTAIDRHAARSQAPLPLSSRAPVHRPTPRLVVSGISTGGSRQSAPPSASTANTDLMQVNFMLVYTFRGQNLLLQGRHLQGEHLILRCLFHSPHLLIPCVTPSRRRNCDARLTLDRIDGGRRASSPSARPLPTLCSSATSTYTRAISRSTNRTTRCATACRCSRTTSTWPSSRRCS